MQFSSLLHFCFCCAVGSKNESDNYCSTCGKTFFNSSTLNRHLKSHDENWVLKCGQCCFKTKRNNHLKEHEERYHASTENVEPTQRQEANASSSQKITELDKTADFDLKLQLSNNFVYSGSTQSGKTTLFMKTLEHAKKIYSPAPTKVVFLYGCWQDIYNNLRESLQDQGIKIEFRQEGIVTKDDLGVMADPNGGQTMIVIDDNSINASENKDVVDAFTKARHNNCCIVLLLHFIFGSQNLAKIRANTSYYLLLKSCENAQQVALLGTKMGLKSALVQAYEQETRKPYGYILIDRCTVTPFQHRIRRNIFEELLGEQPEESKKKEVQKPQHISEEPENLPLARVPSKSEPLIMKPRVWLDWKTYKPSRKQRIRGKKAAAKKKIRKTKPKRKIIEKTVIEKPLRLPWW